jgi:Ca-activated chloride channel family protein
MKTRLLILFLLLSGIAQAISPWERYSITQAVGKGTWEATEEIFRTLRESELPAEQISQVDYNLGVSLYQQEKYEESLPLFESAAKTDQDALKAKALYNQGNALFKLDRLDEAKTAFQQALLANPEDDNTRHNIEVILKKQEEQEQENQKNENSENEQDDSESDEEQQDDEGESDDQEQDKKNEGEQNQDPESEQNGEGDQQDQESGEQEQEQNGQNQEMSEEERQAAQEAAEKARLLDYFKQQERDGRPAKRVRAQAPPVRGKTW